MEIDDLREILPLFLHHSHAAVAIKALDGHYLFANAEYGRYLGTPSEQLLSRRDEDLLPAERAREAQIHDELAITAKRGQSTEERFEANGLTVDYLTARFPVLDDQHQIMALGVIAMEVDREKRNMADAERALKAAQDVNAQLRGAMYALEELASTDRLTNAWNRRRFEETIEGETHRSGRYGHPLAMLLIDVDHFKNVNDTHGHAEGDRVLVEVSHRIRTVLRKSDSLTRWGGEEFIVLMPNTGLAHAQSTAERIREMVASRDIEGIGQLTVSIGVAEYLPSESWNEWLQRTDKAMYRAKQEGRNRVIHDPRLGLSQNAAEHVEGSFVQLVWKDAFCSGDPIIDRQHESLFARVNDLLKAVLSNRPRDELLTAIEQLIDEVKVHFNDEERILESLAFSDLEAHRAEHRRLMARCQVTLGAFKAGSANLGDIFQFLAHELVTRHVLGADRAYFPLTGAHGAGSD